MDRRSFLSRSSLALGATIALPSLPALASESRTPFMPGSWEEIRNQFPLDPAKIHMSQMLFASHPKWVSDAIEKHRKAFDFNAVEYVEENLMKLEKVARQSAATYLQADPEEIVMTDSTTMGLAILYSGLRLKAGDEILTTTHDHYATEKSLEYAVMKNNAVIKRVSLYQNPAQVSVDEVVGTIVKSITPRTRIVAVTWVHSSTGVKLPIRDIADAIKKVNEKRTTVDRIYFCVDGVHAFGIENMTVQNLGCDFLAAGTHKWLFGPRGTGILWGKKDAWDMVIPTIPAFSEMSYGMWLGLVPEGKINFSDLHTPGGFHSYEHRWALNEAFDFHLRIGKDKIEARTHQLSKMLKEGMKEMKHVKLHTPVSASLSAGINCFEVEGMKPEDVVKKLHGKNIIGNTTPYRKVYARLTPSIVNTEVEVKVCLEALAKINS